MHIEGEYNVNGVRLVQIVKTSGVPLPQVFERNAFIDFDEEVREIIKDYLKEPVEVELKVNIGGRVPSQPYPSDACWDIYASQEVIVPKHSTVEVPTSVFINIPKGYEGELKARSSHGKKGISVHHSVYDAGYQGELSPFMHNRTDDDYIIQFHDRVAQFCMRRVILVKWSIVDDFTKSARGDKGHGSSGR